ncbi:MAG: dihydroorotate dehydrogenase electron transfer subunit [Kiritimatiellia bacterium]|jgi:dihydroorotate dehydrogenase electron transfer subunit|nr:dihydroorotate dehydrogenase electron transfer subunit [Kiritimatiellia bacterium]MDP6848817.1 dihydroorotate dehydrogenase electron transfer subunit [Kiritimatiellia bacterium]
MMTSRFWQAEIAGAGGDVEMTEAGLKPEIATARVLSNAAYSGEYRELRLDVTSISGRVKPGQFVHVRVPGLSDRVLRRPFSVFHADMDVLCVLYKVVGQGTEVLASVEKGGNISVLGPLGNGFPPVDESAFPVLVAGGYGVAPLCFFAEHTAAPGVLFVGGATASDILCVERFEKMGWDVHVTTEDGSMGQRGLVTDALDEWLGECELDRPPEFFVCGPDGLLRAIGERCVLQGWKGSLSLDKHMGCGLGACLACVQRLRGPNGEEFWARVCKDGPVFDAEKVVWQ